MLIVFPIGLLATSVIFDTLYSIIRRPVLAFVSYYMIVSGVVGGLLAAIFGLMDWLPLPRNSRAKRIGAWHGLGNFAIVVLFAVTAWLRRGNANLAPNGLAMLLSLAGFGLALITSWIGGGSSIVLVSVWIPEQTSMPLVLSLSQPVPGQ